MCVNDRMGYLVCGGKREMGKGMNWVWGVVEEGMGDEVGVGDVLMLIKRRRRRMKVVDGEEGGMVLYVKGVEEGRLGVGGYERGRRCYGMEWGEVVMMVEGMSENGKERVKRLKGSRKDGLY